MMFIKKLYIKSYQKKIRNLQQDRLHSQPTTEAIIKEKKLYWQLISIYNKFKKKKKFPFAKEMIRECWRKAAEIDDVESQFMLGKNLIEEAQLRETLQKEIVLASAENEKQMLKLYAEGIAYLQSAENLGHIEAKRLHGLCYINGYGVPIDSDKGFHLILESIDQEKSWDKVPQLFAKMGLNKPEFFAALTKHRKSTV